jgi:uncharacterized protein with HEPN domain
MDRDLAHIADIVQSAHAIQRFVADIDQATFLADDLRQSAVLYQLTLIGEACRRVSATFREAHPEVQWPAIIGLRNRIVHEYDDVDLDSVWTVVSKDLPELMVALAALTPPEPDGEEDGHD